MSGVVKTAVYSSSKQDVGTGKIVVSGTKLDGWALVAAMLLEFDAIAPQRLRREWTDAAIDDRGLSCVRECGDHDEGERSRTVTKATGEQSPLSLLNSNLDVA